MRKEKRKTKLLAMYTCSGAVDNNDVMLKKMI